MGILKEPLNWVRRLHLPAGFSVCELGDQYVTCVSPHLLAAEWFREQGCSRYVAIDANGKGTHTADLNLPVAHLQLGTFDLVTDFGTGEHVFDQAQVWRTLHQLTKVDGYLVFDRPSQGYRSHGFYLVDECLLQDIAAVNEYDVTRMTQTETPRGMLIRGVFRKRRDVPFRVPQQGRYLRSMVIAC